MNTRPLDPNDAWLVWSNDHRSWWRANHGGYTTDLREAGAYTMLDAIRICQNASIGWVGPNYPPPEIPVPLLAAHAALMPTVIRNAQRDIDHGKKILP